MRTLTFLTCWLSVILGCSGDRNGGAAHAASDTSMRAPGVAAVSPRSASAPVSVASLAPSAPDPEVRAVCAATAAAWRRVARATVRVLDTALVRTDVIEDAALDSIAPPGAVGGRWRACAVVAEVETGLDSMEERGRYWPAAGWVSFPRLSADGPGAQVQVYQRGLVRCQVASEWDPGDDGDTTYVPSPFQRERSLCWRHGRPVERQDTVNLGG